MKCYVFCRPIVMMVNAVHVRLSVRSSGAQLDGNQIRSATLISMWWGLLMVIVSSTGSTSHSKHVLILSKSFYTNLNKCITFCRKSFCVDWYKNDHETISICSQVHMLFLNLLAQNAAKYFEPSLQNEPWAYLHHLWICEAGSFKNQS